jgi:glycosyltransferase involved in cell wall biosynthesis
MVPTRYPTEKAYGVNIAYTTEALRLLGNKVDIFTAGESSFDSQGNNVIGIKNTFLKLAEFVKNSGHSSVSAVGFYLFQFIFAASAFRIVKKMSLPDLVLTRSPIVAFVVSRIIKYKKRVILELHHMPSKVEIYLINKCTHNVFLAVTNKEFSFQLEQVGLLSNSYVIPNASPTAFHNLSRSKREHSLPITIGYAGKSTSSGHDNGLPIAIKLLENFPDLARRIHFTFIGCEISFGSQVKLAIEEGAIRAESITLIDHLVHDNLLKEIAKFDLALIPYPEEPYYERSFPIKIVEMASAGIPMLISNTSAHRRILGEPNDFFFTPGSHQSLKDKLEKILGNLELISRERERLTKLSNDFTYLKRAEGILLVGNH